MLKKAMFPLLLASLLCTPYKANACVAWSVWSKPSKIEIIVDGTFVIKGDEELGRGEILVTRVHKGRTRKAYQIEQPIPTNEWEEECGWPSPPATGTYAKYALKRLSRNLYLIIGIAHLSEEGK